MRRYQENKARLFTVAHTTGGWKTDNLCQNERFRQDVGKKNKKNQTIFIIRTAKHHKKLPKDVVPSLGAFKI